MKLAIDIIKNILLPKLEKDSGFESTKINTSFWETFTIAFLDFESDAKPIYSTIYSLGLNDSEKIIYKLDAIYAAFIKELAENYVLGNTSEATEKLLESKNATFETEIRYFSNLEKAIKKAERKRIKTELPTCYEKLTFELSDNDIAAAIKRKEREALKAKMNAWNEELVASEEVPVYSLNTKETETFLPKAASIPALVLFNKKIVLSKLQLIQWIKYSILTATVGVTGTIVYKTKFEKQEPEKIPVEVAAPIKVEKNIDTLSVKKNDSIIEEEEEEENIIIDSSQTEKGEEKEVKNTEHSGIIKKDYKVLYYNIQPKITGLYNYLITNENENNTNKKYKEEYGKLVNQLNKYTFIAKSLTIYKEMKSKTGFVLTDENGNLYFYDGKNYYGIIKTETPLEFKVVEDPDIIEELDIIIKYGT